MHPRTHNAPAQFGARVLCQTALFAYVPISQANNDVECRDATQGNALPRAPSALAGTDSRQQTRRKPRQGPYDDSRFARRADRQASREPARKKEPAKQKEMTPRLLMPRTPF